MESPVVYEAPPWSSDDGSSDGVIEAPFSGPPAPAAQSQGRFAPPPEAPVDPRLPFAPTAVWPISSMPAFSGAFSGGLAAPRSQLAQEPVALQPPLSGHVLGVVTIAVGLGTAAGIYYGGPFGAVAGSLFGGAAANAYKAFSSYKSGTPDGDSEAKVSATYAVIAAALGGWVAYKFAKPRSGFERNPEQEPASGGAGSPTRPTEMSEASAKQNPCRPRRAYPVVAKACEGTT